MIIVPVSTDAPVYHPPRGTFFLILANLGIYFYQLLIWMRGGSLEFFEPFYLHFGTINPIQWVTSIFLHAGFLHVFGNMIFLWTFGLIVEGKIGTARFLLIYFLIGTAESAVGQLLMLGGCGTAIGASGAIFGLLAVSFVWAPKNDLKVLLIFWIIPTIFETIEVSVLISCFYMLAWEVILEVLLIGITNGSQIMSSAFCHLMGAAIGGAIGYWMVKTRRVDCEGYDLLSVTAGKEGQKILTLEQEAELKARRAEQVEKIAQEHEKADHFIQLYLEHENPDMAVGRFRALKSMDPAAKWNPDYLSHLIKLFAKQKRWNDACFYLEEFARRKPARIVDAKIKQAEIQILKNSRPAEGLRILRGIQKNKLTGKQIEKCQKLATEAYARMEEGDLEIAD